MTAMPNIAAVLAAASLLGCSIKEAPKEETPPKIATAAEAPVSTPQKPRETVSSPASPPTGTSFDPSKEQALANGKIIAVTLLSPRSLSVKLRMEGGAQAVFKPIRKGDRRATFEAAAYRMATLLGIERVPVAVMRKIPLSFLVHRLEIDNPDAAAALTDAVPKDDKNEVEGAMIEWMEDIDPNGLEAVGGMKEINRLLRLGRPDDRNAALALAASNMVVFDHIIGNWDRFSGGNFFVSKDAAHLILIDHNGSFTPWPDKRQARMEQRLLTIERFSASMLARIRALTPERVRKAIAQDSIGPLLNDDQIQLLMSRKDEVLRHADKLIAKNGIDPIAAYP